MAKKMDKNTQIAIGVGILAVAGVIIGVGVNQGWFKGSSSSSNLDNTSSTVVSSPTLTTSKAQKVNDWTTAGKNVVDAGLGIYGSVKGLFGTKESASNTSVSADGSCRINEFGIIEKAQ